MENSVGPSKANLHEDDFFTWTQQQAALMRNGQFDRVDVTNVIEEIETLGRSEAAALESAYRLICMHQLKRMAQPALAESRSWTKTIARERLNAARLLRQNPGLKPRREDLFQAAYDDARKEAAIETGLAPAIFPIEAPFTLDQITDEGYWARAPLVVTPEKSTGQGPAD